MREPVGDLLFLSCNYEVSDYTISSQFYHELLLWWSEFRESFASQVDRNNKKIWIDNKPLYIITIISSLESFTYTIFYLI